SGTELFFRDGQGWMTVAAVVTEPEFRVASRTRLFDASAYDFDPSYRAYDVARDDQRFIMLQRGEIQEEFAADMVLVENWLTEMRQAMERR
nr:hypothetical protein [Gemmatimonadota bacterium]NIY12330.1 hypothetical protein [Gemmatimonadota bacterium]